MIVNYNSIKNKIIKYSSSVDVSMDKNGYSFLCRRDLCENEKSIDMVKSYLDACEINVEEYDVIYRRTVGGWGLPIITIYIKKIKYRAG